MFEAFNTLKAKLVSAPVITTPELLNVIRKVRDELQIDLNFKGK